MLQSMTGFGRATASAPDKKITVEIKTLNSKQLDVQMRIPSYFRESEVGVRNELQRLLRRGKVDVVVTMDSLGEETSLSLNASALRGYRSQILALGREFSLPEPEDWYSLLLRMPEAFKNEQAEVDEATLKTLYEALEGACAAVTAFRSAEGEKLARFFREKIGNIRQLLSEVDPFEAQRVPKIRQRLEEQLAKLDNIEYDRGRLEQEMIFYIEKLDVTEEKLRLRTHMDYFLETMNGEAEGKKLGFIAQEMGREINTLGSKANDADMQRLVVRMKDELEQIKEQVLNVL